MASGAGLMANVLLKDHWGRSRPIDVTQFGGNERFVAWWDPRGNCASNCSFVSGDVSGAFWTVAPRGIGAATVARHRLWRGTRDSGPAWQWCA
jgi:hypothetical protein